jgi:hypothetical protein
MKKKLPEHLSLSKLDRKSNFNSCLNNSKLDDLEECMKMFGHVGVDGKGNASR